MNETILHALTTTWLPAFLPGRRWFQAKGRPIASVCCLDCVSLSITHACAYYWLFIAVGFDQGPEQTYSLPVGVATGEHLPAGADDDRWLIGQTNLDNKQYFVFDAIISAAFRRALIEGLAAAEIVEGRDGPLQFRHTAAIGAPERILDLPTACPQLEQSHTAITVGDAFFLKLYKRLQPGLNPEVEVGEHLTVATSFTQIARVAGAITYAPAGRLPPYAPRARAGQEPYTLGVLQEYVAGGTDAWTHTLAFLARLHAHVVAGGAADSFSGLDDSLRLAQLLGRRVGELHRALAAPTDNPAFAPEPLTQDDLGHQAHLIARECRELRALAAPSEQTAQNIDVVLTSAAITAAVSHWLTMATTKLGSASKTRFHGDLHLGQILLSANDIVIIDFEGEPGKTLAERRAKQSPLRDVAGMLRSFSYAAHMSVGQCAHTDAADGTAPATAARSWERRVCREFISGYGQGSGTALDLDDPMLSLFRLEKALYELRYEIDNRPDWIDIPLAGIRDCLAQVTTKSPAPSP